MKTAFFSLLFFFFLIKSSFGQEIYVVSSDNKLYRLNLDDCSIQFVVQVQRHFFDISFDPGGKLYGISPGGSLYQIDTLSGLTTLITIFNDFNQEFNSLTIGADGTIYTTGDLGDLWSFSPSSGVAVFLGNIGFHPSGDLTFYHGELYVAASADQIVKINLTHPNQSHIVIHENIPGNILGIVSNFVDCNKINCYAITGGMSGIYLIDFEHQDLQLICQLNITVYGGASTSEFLNSAPLQIDTLIGINANCKNEGGILSIEASGGVGSLEYSMNGSPFVNDTFFNDLTAGQYTVIIRDEKGCMDTADITLTAALSPRLDSIIVIPSQCNKDNGSLIVQASGGTGSLLYSIDSTAFQSEGSFENLSPQEYTLWVVDEAGCYVVDQALIAAYGGASILSVEIMNTSCGRENGKITVATDSLTGIMYSLNGVDFQNENEFTSLGANTFHLTIRDLHGCLDTLTVSLAPSTSPKLDVIGTLPERCGKEDGSIAVEGMGGIAPYQYSLDGKTYQSIDSFIHLGAGTYKLYMVDQAACVDSIFASIAEVAGLNIADMEIQPTGCGVSTGSITLNVLGGSSPFDYSIDNQSPQSDPSFEQLGVGHYIILVIDASGCQADTIVTITRTGCPLYIPNVFSPNGDGINDVFKPETVDNQNVKITRFYVFDRWGDNVFQATNLDIHSSDGWWDGKFKRITVNPGVFAYYIEAEFDNGERETFKGDITIVR